MKLNITIGQLKKMLIMCDYLKVNINNTLYENSAGRRYLRSMANGHNMIVYSISDDVCTIHTELD